jgi:hypothetical protein
LAEKLNPIIGHEDASEVKSSIGVNSLFLPKSVTTRRCKMKTTKASPQGTDRKTAAVVGVLFILGTVPALLSLPLMQNTVGAPDPLTAIATHEGQMIIFTAIKFIMGIACAGIGLALYPILKKYNEGLAIGSAGFSYRGSAPSCWRSPLCCPIGTKPGIRESGGSGVIVLSDSRCSAQRRNRLV